MIVRNKLTESYLLNHENRRRYAF